MKTDIRALLLTDVVDSTKLAARIGDQQMAALWAAHDRVARDLLPQHGGREIDKTDGMLLMFDAAASAVSYALAYHRALAKLSTPLAARAGLHVGPVILRENSAEDVARGAKPIEVDGLAKPTAARVMSMARGGQVLLTPEAVADLNGPPAEAGAAAPPEPAAWRTTSHGHWALKGLTDPIEVFEVGDGETKFQPPEEAEKAHRMVRSGERWVPVSALPNNLPPQRSTFVGRATELAEIKALLEESPLVTVLGMGGLGKTRVTLQAAAELLPRYPDGAWFVDLSGVSDAALVVGALARVFQIIDEPGRPLIDTVCGWLKTKRLLIVLDNCEHVVGAAAELADAILLSAPDVQLLASSRELLDVPGEQSYPILPLPLPPKGASLETLLQSAAVRMFADRAKAQRPSFSLEAQEPAMLAELVTRLEGIPLAIELAAARLRTLSIPEILEGLEDRYQFLAGGSRVLQRRQQTLRALVDWSYDMLEDDEKLVFARLAAFAGGFDGAAVKEVCGDEKVPAKRVPDLLSSLVQKSLVARDSEMAQSRYRMLETLRDYAREKLAELDAAGATAARHCAYFFALAKSAARGMHGAEQARWVRQLEAELENLRVAIAGSLAGTGGTDPLVAVKLTAALAGFWMLRGHATEGRRLVKAALALPAVRQSDMAQAWGLVTGAMLASSQGDHVSAREMLETCLMLRRKLGNPVEIAATLSTLSHAQLQLGEPDAAIQSESEALELFSQADDKFGQAIAWLHLGQTRLWAGDAEAALADLEKSLTLARAIANREVEAESEQNVAQAHLIRGKPSLATDALRRSLQVCKDAADQRGEARAHWWLGHVALEEREAGAARTPLQRALREFQAHEMRAELMGCLDDLALLLELEGSPAAALELAAAADQARQRLMLRRSPRDEERWRTRLATLRAQLPAVVADSAIESGRAWETDQAVRAAMDEGAAAA